MSNDKFLRFVTYVLTTPREKVVDEIAAYLDKKNSGDDYKMEKDLEDLFKNSEFGSIFERQNSETAE